MNEYEDGIDAEHGTGAFAPTPDVEQTYLDSTSRVSLRDTLFLFFGSIRVDYSEGCCDDPISVLCTACGELGGRS